MIQDTKSGGKDTAPAALKTWPDWVAAYTRRFSSPNRLELLARATADTKQEESQNFDYVLECTWIES